MENNDIKKYVIKPLHNFLFCPISALEKIFNPRNTQCIPVVKNFFRLELKQNSLLCKGFIIILLIALISCGCNVVGCSSSDKNNEQKHLIKVGEIKLFTNEFNQIFDIVKVGYAKDINETEAKIARFRLLINLTNEMLLINEAKKLGSDISEQELNKAINNIKADYPDDLFDKMFIEKAISFEVWKKRLKSQLIIDKLIKSNLLKKVTILPEDIRKYYGQPYNNGEKEQKTEEENKYGKTAFILNNNRKLVQYLRNEKAQELYGDWFEKFNKSYPIEIDKKEWRKVFGE